MSPSATEVASVPPPLCVTTWSIAAPSLEANHVERRKKSRPPSAKVTPGTDCIRRVASISRATFSSSGTRNGSSRAAPRQEAVTGSTGDSTHRFAGQPLSRLRDAPRPAAPSGDLALVQARGGGEAPPAAREHADPDPRGGGALDALHLPGCGPSATRFRPCPLARRHSPRPPFGRPRPPASRGPATRHSLLYVPPATGGMVPVAVESDPPDTGRWNRPRKPGGPKRPRRCHDAAWYPRPKESGRCPSNAPPSTPGSSWGPTPSRASPRPPGGRIEARDVPHRPATRWRPPAASPRSPRRLRGDGGGRDRPHRRRRLRAVARGTRSWCPPGRCTTWRRAPTARRSS